LTQFFLCTVISIQNEYSPGKIFNTVFWITLDSINVETIKIKLGNILDRH
jgi:hypothetical protein